MSEPKSHHYVAKTILRRFCFAGETLHFYSKRTKSKGVQSRKVDSVFCKRHLNTIDMGDGQRDFGLEKFFAKEFDDYLPSFIEAFDSWFTQNPNLLIGESRRRFVQFFYNHMCITPDFHEPIVKQATADVFTKDIIEKYEREQGPLSAEDQAFLNSDREISKLVNRSRVQTLGRQSETVLESLNKMNLVAARPKKRSKNFVVASNPIVRFQNGIDPSIETGNIELWTTLTPELAIGFVCEKSSVALELPDYAVRKINYNLFKNSVCFASKNKKLMESIINSR